jgi:hypothetical protein
MNVEEHFAPNALDSDSESISSVESVEMPVKRYATRSQNATTIIKQLKEDNIKQMKSKLKKEESEQIHYLSLDNATKELEIQELKDTIKKYEENMMPMKMYEEAFKNFEKNLATYKRLIDDVPNKEYSELIMCESHEIVVIEKPIVHVNEMKLSYESLEHTYNNKYTLQKQLSNEFHEKMLQESIKKRRMYKVIDFSMIVVLIIFYFCVQYYFGK